MPGQAAASAGVPSLMLSAALRNSLARAFLDWTVAPNGALLVYLDGLLEDGRASEPRWLGADCGVASVTAAEPS